MIVICPGVSRISIGYDATESIRGMPYGVQMTAALGGGSSRFVASASAARWASYLALYSPLRSSGVAAGGRIFGSTPRPPCSGAQAPIRLGAADWAWGVLSQRRVVAAMAA